MRHLREILLLAMFFKSLVTSYITLEKNLRCGRGVTLFMFSPPVVPVEIRAGVFSPLCLLLCGLRVRVRPPYFLDI